MSEFKLAEKDFYEWLTGEERAVFYILLRSTLDDDEKQMVCDIRHSLIEARKERDKWRNECLAVT